jgi:cellulose synthase/poly-beta-1,6-N-acetylglucosamine synthase-like glycosyltransferase
LIAASFVLVVWCVVASVFTLVAFQSVGRLLGRLRDLARPSPGPWPSVAILRPCEGLDTDLAGNLLSAATARYDGRRAVYLLVPSVDDPAHAIARDVVEAARTAAPDVPVHLVVTAIDTPSNRKVAQLARAETDAEVVVIADSDLRFTDETLPALVGAIRSEPRAGASCAAYLEENCDSVGDWWSGALLSSTPHAFYCLSALAERSGGAHVLGGALVAIWRRVLDEVGGFASFEQFLGEDFELAKRLHARGYTIPISPQPAHITERGRSLGWVLRRFARWSTVTRQQRQHLFPTYFLLLACTPLLVALAALLLLLDAPYASWAAAAAAIAVLARLALATRLRRALQLPADPVRTIAALLAGEVLIVIASVLALGPPIIEWRGKRYHVGPGGFLRRLS